MLRATDFAGGQPSWSIIQTGSRIAIMAIGFIPMTVGIGFPTIPGVRAHFIMAAGFMMPVTAGAGGRKRPGRRHGFAGVNRLISAAGRRCRRARSFAKARVSFSMARLSGRVSISASV